MPNDAGVHHGVVIIDKPSGWTSHDVVQRVRRVLGQRSVGHAGTLDPLATGVLVVAVGEGTKLVSYLQADDKRYEVTIGLGEETDSLDADGEVIETAAVPPLDESTVGRALARFIGRHRQRPPKVSAIKVGGSPLHRRTRRGEDVQAPLRDVELFSATIHEVSEDEIRLTLHCGKGFYVRSLARDLARALGTVGHVKALRRTASGRFRLDDAIDGSRLTAEAIAARIVPLRDACVGLPRVELSPEGVGHARHGRPIGPESVLGDPWREAQADRTLALFGPDGEPVALGRRNGEVIRVVRGFSAAPPRVVGR